MRSLMIGGLCLGMLFAPASIAQRGGSSGHAGGWGMHPPQQSGSGSRFGAPFAHNAFSHGSALGNRGYAYVGYTLPDYSGAYGDDFYNPGRYGQESYQQPIVIALPQPAPPVYPPPPPPEPAKPEVHNYNWPDGQKTAAQTFSITLRDGTVHFAIAVWVQDGIMHYREQDGSSREAPLDAVDRESTRRLNAAQGLNLAL